MIEQRPELTTFLMEHNFYLKEQRTHNGTDTWVFGRHFFLNRRQLNSHFKGNLQYLLPMLKF